MPAVLFLRITGLPWDEFRVAWKLYKAHHGTSLRKLTIWSILVALMFCLPASFFSIPAVDVSELLFQTQSYTGTFSGNSSASPLFLIAVLIPLLVLFVPCQIEEPVPGIEKSILLCARLSSLCIQLLMAIVFVTSLSLLVSRSVRNLLLYSAGEFWATFAIELLAIGIVVITLQRFHTFRGQVSGWWLLSYLVWLPSYILLRNAAWERPFMFWDNPGQSYDHLYLVGNMAPFLYFAVPLSLLLVMQLPIVARIMFPVMCLATVFCAFVLAQLPELLLRFAILHVVSYFGWILIGVPGGGVLEGVSFHQ